MKINELRPNQLVCDGNTLIKISNVHDSEVTAQVLFPVPPRTTVRTYTAEQVWMLFREPGHRILTQYERAYAS